MAEKKESKVVVQALRDCKISTKEFSYKFNSGEQKEILKSHSDILLKTKFVKLVK